MCNFNLLKPRTMNTNDLQYRRERYNYKKSQSVFIRLTTRDLRIIEMCRQNLFEYGYKKGNGFYNEYGQEIDITFTVEMQLKNIEKAEQEILTRDLPLFSSLTKEDKVSLWYACTKPNVNIEPIIRTDLTTLITVDSKTLENIFMDDSQYCYMLDNNDKDDGRDYVQEQNDEFWAGMNDEEMDAWNCNTN